MTDYRIHGRIPAKPRWNRHAFNYVTAKPESAWKRFTAWLQFNLCH